MKANFKEPVTDLNDLADFAKQDDPNQNPVNPNES